MTKEQTEQTDTTEQTDETKPARTRKNRSTSDVIQGARDRKQSEVIKLEVRQKQVIDELKTVEAKLHDARAELGRLDLALGGATHVGKAVLSNGVTVEAQPRAAE